MIDSYGGKECLRDQNPLISALEMPKATFVDKELHAALFDQAAADLYHIAGKHSFIDGNKQITAELSSTFLAVMINKMSYEELVVAKELIAHFLNTRE